MKKLLTALPLLALLCLGHARAQDEPPSLPRTFDAPSLGQKLDDFKKVFHYKTKFLGNKWTYQPGADDGDLQSAYKYVEHRTSNIQMGPDDKEQKITGIFIKNICVGVIIEQSAPFSWQDVDRDAGRFLSGVIFDMPGQGNATGKMLRSTSHNSQFVIRCLQAGEPGYRLELLNPTLFMEQKSKTSPIWPKDGAFDLSENSAALGGCVRTVLFGEDKKKVMAFWSHPNEDEAAWSLNIPEDATYLVEITYGITEHPMMKFGFEAGNSKFEWKATENDRPITPMKKALAKVKMQKGRQHFTVKLLDKGNDCAFQLHKIRLTKTQGKSKAQTPIDLVNEELAYYRTLIEDQSTPKLNELKENFRSKMNEMGTLYQSKRNVIAGSAVKSAKEHIDDFDLLGAVEKSIAHYGDYSLEKGQRDFPVDKSFLVGKWKDKTGNKEVEFRVMGKVTVYRDGKRDMKANEDSYSFSEKDESFTVISKEGWGLYKIDIYNENLISIKGSKFERGEKEKKAGEE